MINCHLFIRASHRVNRTHIEWAATVINVFTNVSSDTRTRRHIRSWIYCLVSLLRSRWLGTANVVLYLYCSPFHEEKERESHMKCTKTTRRGKHIEHNPTSTVHLLGTSQWECWLHNCRKCWIPQTWVHLKHIIYIWNQISVAKISANRL